MEQEEQIETETTKVPAGKPLLRRIVKLLALAVLIIAVLFGLAFAYLYTHQDKIKSTITSTLNEQLATEVSVGSINIDFFSKFPEVSVRFSGVRAQEAIAKPQQALFLFKGIYVRFGIWDLIDGDYTIRKLSFDEGEVNLRILLDGTNNWHFWKDQESTDDQESAPIALEDVEWNNARFRYIDEKLALRVLVEINNLRVNGNFADEVFTASAITDLVLQDLTYNDLDLADDVPVSGSAEINVSDLSTALNLQDLRVGNINLAGNGTVEHKNVNQRWEVKSSGSSLRDWMPLIPKHWRPKIEPADLSGNTDAAITININSAATEVIAQAKLLQAGINLDDANISLQKGTGTVTYHMVQSNNKINSKLTIAGAELKTRTGDLSISATIEDLLHPKLDADCRFNMQVEELLNITRPGLIKSARGIVSGNFTYGQKFANWDELRTKVFDSPKLNGELALKNGSLELENSNLHLQDVSADLQLKNKDLIIDRLFLREGKSEFLIDGWFYNAIYLGPNPPIPTLSVRLQSKYLDLDRIMGWEFPKRSEEQGEYSANRDQPLALKFKVDLDIKHFNLIRFNGYDLTGEVWNEGLKIKGKDIAFKGLDGRVDGNFAWSTEPSGYRFWTNVKLSKIDIHQLFNGFENFGQNWLLADNIYGMGTASIETSMDFDNKLTFIPASFKLASDIDIQNGRLVGYKPLLSLNSLVETKALEDVRFDGLQNQITIANQVIFIPQMDIKSSALNLRLMGRHSFDQQIDYSIRLALADVVKKKKAKKTDLDDWIIEVENTDQPYIWVHVGCTVEEPCLSLDREMLKKGVKDEWKQQGEDIKNIFKPDTTSTPTKDPTKGEVIFEWEEEEPDTNKR